MIINVIYIQSFLAFEPEYQAPVATHHYRVEPGEIAAQTVKPPTRCIHIFCAHRMLQSSKLEPESAGMLRLNTRLGTGFKELLKAFVPEALDHLISVKWCFTLVKPSDAERLRMRQLPATVMFPISIEPLRILPRVSTSLPTALMRWNMSLRLPAMVISSTGY